MNMEMVVEHGGGKVVTATIGDIVIKTDQSVESGGSGSAPEPFTLFLASIGTCAGIYVYSFCQSRNIPTKGIRIVTKMHPHETKPLIGKFQMDIQLNDDFPEKYRKAVIRSASLCAVKKHLMDPPEFEIFTTTPQEKID
jgi:putative redox protein